MSILEQWDDIRKRGSSVSVYFVVNQLKKIIICGRNRLAEMLMDDIQDAKLEVVYSMDTRCSLTTWNPRIEDWDADIVVVTDMDNYYVLEKEICSKLLIEVISIQELVDKIFRYKERT